MTALTLPVGCSCPVSSVKPSPMHAFVSSLQKHASKPGYPISASPNAGSPLSSMRECKSIVLLHQATLPLSDLVGLLQPFLLERSR